jgi:hypothetical protein
LIRFYVPCWPSSFVVVELLGRINLPPQQVGQHGIFVGTPGGA